MRKYIAIFILVGAGLPIPAFINIALSDSSLVEKHYKDATTYHDLGEF